jgi:hypothetical protein
VIVACVVAANLALVLSLALHDLHQRRRRRREISRLNALFDAPAHALSPARRGGSRLIIRSTVAAAAVLVLSGVAMADPTIREAIISTANRAADVVIGEREPGSAAADETTSPPSSSERSASPSAGERPADPGRSEAVGGANGNVREGTAPGPEPPPAAGDGSSPSEPTDDVPTPTPPDTPSDPSTSPDPTFTAEAEATSPTTILVTWSRMPTAKAYSVSRAISGSSDWSEVARVPAGKVSAVSNELEPGTTYLFRVTAMLARGGEEPVAQTSATTPAAA